MEVPVIGLFTSALQAFVLSIRLTMIVSNVNRTENVIASVTDRMIKNGLGIFIIGVAMLIWGAFRFGHPEGVPMWTAGGIIVILGLNWVLQAIVQKKPIEDRRRAIWLVWLSSILTLLLAFCYLGLYLSIEY